jgi:tyrosyl-tRNA synthetase
MTSPYRFYQFWINADDADVPSHLRVFSLRSGEEIAELLAQQEAAPGARIPHQALAREMTERVHGTEHADRVVSASRILFGEIDPRAAGPGTWPLLAAELPCIEIDLTTPKSAVELVTLAGLCKSKGEARRLIAQRGISLNGRPLGEEATAGTEDLLEGRYLWLRRGKKHDAILAVAGR